MDKQLIAEEIRTLLDTEDSLDAIAEVLAERMTHTVPNVMLTEVDGLVIGWDTCGSCLMHIRICRCATGPVRPHYLESWSGKHAGYQAGSAVPTAVDSAHVAESEPGAAVATVTAIKKRARSQVFQECSGCGQPVTDESGDRNDDGTWTCFVCQTTHA